MGRKKVNLANKRFGRLIVLEEAGKSKSGACLWRCKCECGKEKIIKSSHLISGNNKSCGCWLKSNKKNFGENINLLGPNPRQLPPGTSRVNERFRRIKLSAQRRGYDFKLSMEDFKKISKQNCFYCGDPPKRFQAYKLKR